MSNNQRTVSGRMRPNIQISHALNGRVKDYAAEHDLTTSEAYREIIERGLEELEAVHAARTALEGDDPDVALARSELDAALEGIGE